MSALILVAGSGVSISSHKCIATICISDVGLKKNDCCSPSSHQEGGVGFSKAKCCFTEYFFCKLTVENSTNNNLQILLPRILNSISFSLENFSIKNYDFVSLKKRDIKIDPLILFQRLQI